MICQISLSVISFLNELKLICLHTNIATVSTQWNGFNYCYQSLIMLLIIYLHTVKWLQILLFNINYSIKTLCTQSNVSKYYVISIIQFRHTVQEFQVLLFNVDNSIQHNSFICIQLNGFKYCYASLTIQLILFTHC